MLRKRGVKQVRRSVVAHVAEAALGVGDCGYAITYMQVFFGYDAVRDQSGDGVIRAAHFGHFERFGIVEEAADVGDLAAGFGVDRGAVEDDFRFRTFFDFVYLALLGDDGFDAAIARVGAKVKIRLGLVCLRKL